MTQYFGSFEQAPTKWEFSNRALTPNRLPECLLVLRRMLRGVTPAIVEK